MSDRSGCCSSGSSCTPPRVVTLTNTQVTHSASQTKVSNAPENVKLGVLDHVSAPLLIVKMPFVFSQTLDSVLLTSSLASMLSRYPLFSGRLIIDSEGDYSVALNNSGASLTIAKCPTATLADLLPKGMEVASSSPSSAQKSKISAVAASAPAAVTGVPPSSYTPQDMTPFLPKVPALILGYRDKDVPLFHAQVTFLKNGGTVLGIAVPHLLADQETCRLLFKCWAAEYTALDVSKIGGDNMREPGSEVQQQREQEEKQKQKQLEQGQPGEQYFEIQADGSKKMVKNALRAQSLSMPSMAGLALESHATPALPKGWKSSRFEKRSWKYIPSLLGGGIMYACIGGMPTTVAYYVSAKRLGELKAEASKQIKSAAASGGSSQNTDVPWISTNDALVARVRQALAQSLPGKAGKKELQLVVDLRKRMEPALPAETLGNCSWTVAVGSDTTLTEEPTLGALAADIRAVILELSNSTTPATATTTTVQSKNKKDKIINNEDIRNELRYLINNTRPGGAQMPVVFQNFNDMVRFSGPILVSQWDWGGAEYRDMSFGGGPESSPVWHQPTFPGLPNCAFIVPAPCGGALVHLTLHKKMARKLKAKCIAL